jgi:hypothetical protein
MFWLLVTVLVVVAFFAVAARRRSYESVESEPWRASLDDDEPLDMEAARQAEEEWLQRNQWEDDNEESEPWRG